MMLSMEIVFGELMRIKPILQTMKYPLKRIGLFGSVARNKAHEGSDLDILLDYGTDDDTIVVCGSLEVEKLLQRIFVHERLDVNSYPLPQGDPGELIWR